MRFVNQDDTNSSLLTQEKMRLCSKPRDAQGVVHLAQLSCKASWQGANSCWLNYPHIRFPYLSAVRHSYPWYPCISETPCGCSQLNASSRKPRQRACPKQGQMEGYAKIAQRMATLPNVAIFRRFQALRAQNLLYMQAELVELEARFRDQAEKDAQSQDQNEKLFSRDWFTLSMPMENGEYSPQWKLALEIRKKLENYGMQISTCRQCFRGSCARQIKRSYTIANYLQY
jgi:hypothetical protein